ncbi:MAG: redox-regulated ATPase YchF [Nanoarchaeota archaeon]|nr:redox-regulated ATPase YchF [Nanoarchaeota archaeon]MBU1028449.1 redox-regulated ATPase YchF [Nanoarchaeota archaeon]
MLLALVGKPNCGKSTFFKAATLAEVEIGNRPFVTIKANHGVGYVKVECIDKEFGVQCNPSHGFCIGGNRFVSVEIMDVAGLVPGASEGKGLGNQFLDELRNADCFIHIVDASGETNIEGKQGKGDPIEDVSFLEEELDMWYYNIFIKVWKSFARKIEMEKVKFSEAVAKQFSGLKVDEEHVKEALRKLDLPEKPSTWGEKDIKLFVSTLRKLSKPMIIAANKIDKYSGKENYRKLREEFPNLIIVPCSADSELALRQAAKAELIEYIPGDKEFKVKKQLNDKQESALNKIKREVLGVYVEGTGVQSVLNSAVFSLLKYIAVFPAGANKLGDSKGNILPDCFLLPKGSTALDFAFFLHTDFGKNFIKAIDARSKRALGKNYKLKHRDALEIVTR